MKNLPQNKIKRLITLLLLVFNFASCSCQEDYGKISDNIMFETAKQLKKEKGLSFAGYGGARMYDVEQLNLCLSSNEYANIEQARKLLVYCTNKLIDNVNNSEKVRPYLRNYPFTSKNISLGISFDDDSHLGAPYIAMASIYRGKITYYIQNPEVLPMEEFHEETFEDALEIVNNENPSSG